MRSTDCGLGIADRGVDVRPSNPRSAVRNPQWPVGALLLALLAPPAGAQQPDSLPKDTTTLAPVVVTGVRLPAVRELARGLAGRTATLGSADLDARGVRSLADALEQLPGVTTSDELGATGQMDVSLRGFQVSPVIGLPQGVTVYVDGVRANEPDAHEVNFDLLPLEDVERVEVVYGPSVLLGRNALGAAVNLVTRRGATPAAGEVEASAGSWGRYELKARAGNRHGVWDYYVGARYEREQGWRRDTRSRIATLFAKLGLLNHTWDATLSYSGADNRIFQAGSLPESLAATDPRLNFTGGDYFAPRAHLVILNAQRLLGRGTQLALNAFGRSLESEQFNVNFVGQDSRQRNATRTAGGAVQLSGRIPLGGRQLRWLAGADADVDRVAVRIFAVPGGGAPDSLTEAVRTNQVNAGAFAGANVDLVPRLTATIAARYDWIRVPFEDLIDPTQDGLNIFRRLSPRGGLTWRAGADQELFTSVSRGFRAPAVVELACADPAAACPLPFALGPDPALKPVVATTYELGWRARLPRRRLDASADVYRTDVRDDIFFIASTVTGGYFQNIRATRRSGVEVALQWSGRGGARAYANYGYTRATFRTTALLATTRDTAGETVRPGDALPLVPDHRVNAGVAVPLVTARNASGLSLAAALDGRYVGRQWLRGDEENATRRLSDYAVADLSLTAGWRELELRCAVGNLLDRRYVNFGTFAENPTAPGAPVQRWLTPGLPRHVQVSLSRDF
jgi:iron complex outermembrane recepter protein